MDRTCPAIGISVSPAALPKCSAAKSRSKPNSRSNRELWYSKRTASRWIKSKANHWPGTTTKFLPLPKGEGRGEGEVRSPVSWASNGTFQICPMNVSSKQLKWPMTQVPCKRSPQSRAQARSTQGGRVGGNCRRVEHAAFPPPHVALGPSQAPYMVFGSHRVLRWLRALGFRLRLAHGIHSPPRIHAQVQAAGPCNRASRRHSCKPWTPLLSRSFIAAHHARRLSLRPRALDRIHSVFAGIHTTVSPLR